MSKKPGRRRKAGRPQFRPTPTMRRQVAIAAGGGMSHEEIAIGLGVARGTLEKHFSEELTKGAYRKRLAVMVANYQAALKGSVPAQKAYLSSMPQAAAPERPPPAAPDARLGKKQQAALDALDAEKNTGWEGLLGPSPPLQ